MNTRCENRTIRENKNTRHTRMESDLHKKWSHDPEYRAAYEELGLEFDLARVLIEARIGAKLTQAQLAERMETTQSVIARNTP